MTICSRQCDRFSAINCVLYYSLRYKKQGIVKLAGSFESTSATNITALSSVNDFCSCILFLLLLLALQQEYWSLECRNVIEGKVNPK